MTAKPPAPEVSFEINGEAVVGHAEPRTSLADFLREDLDLTGTHLGCEHGVCGACTVEVDGQPVRSCITLVHACNGRKVRTIEGYDDDPVMAALRDAFMQFHGLQCGFCTPGMLVACRDIILRHQQLDDAAIRIALGGNICRCTGYVGIVSAVKSVFEQRSELLVEGSAGLEPPSLSARPNTPLAHFKRTSGQMEQGEVVGADTNRGDDQNLYETISVQCSVDEVWDFLRDVERVVPCVPGARLLSVDGEDLEMEMEVSMGAIRARFHGTGRFTFDDSTRKGRFEGEGRDARSGSSATGSLDFSVVPSSRDDRCQIQLVASYGVTGALSQFSRGGLVRSFVGAMARMFGENVQKVVAGGEASSVPASNLNVFRLLGSVIKSWLKTLFRRH